MTVSMIRKWRWLCTQHGN